MTAKIIRDDFEIARHWRSMGFRIIPTLSGGGVVLVGAIVGRPQITRMIHHFRAAPY
jgi:hypothetical protein